MGEVLTFGLGPDGRPFALTEVFQDPCTGSQMRRLSSFPSYVKRVWAHGLELKGSQEKHVDGGARCEDVEYNEPKCADIFPWVGTRS